MEEEVASKVVAADRLVLKAALCPSDYSSPRFSFGTLFAATQTACSGKYEWPGRRLELRSKGARAPRTYYDLLTKIKILAFQRSHESAVYSWGPRLPPQAH